MLRKSKAEIVGAKVTLIKPGLRRKNKFIINYPHLDHP